MNVMFNFGFPDQWPDFSRRNQQFMRKFPVLMNAVEKGLMRTAHMPDSVDLTIFFTGRLCFEDFMEILLLAGNGYGVGALKLVRGLYERAVVIAYLAMHPEKAVDFLDYSKVERVKGINAHLSAYPDDEIANQVLAEAELEKAALAGKFVKTSSWSGLDFVSMAKSVGPLGKLLSSAYYLPLAHAHGTARAVTARLVIGPGGGLEFDASPTHVEADKAVETAHRILLLILGTQNEWFEPAGLDEALSPCLSDFVEIWKDREGII